MNRRLSWPAAVGHALVACGPHGLLGVAWCVPFHSAAAAEEAAPADAGQLDKTAPAAGTGAAPAAPQEAPVAAESTDEIRAERDRLEADAVRLKAEGKYAEARAAAEAMLALELRWRGYDHPDVLGSINLLAEIAEASEDWPAAEARRSEALAWLEKNQSADHWQTNDARWALGDLAFQRALTADQREKLKTADAALKEAARLSRLGNNREALPLAQQAAAIRREILGPTHRDYTASLIWVAYLFEAMDDYARAKPLYQQVLEIDRAALGESHPDFATDLKQLAALYETIGDYAQAEPLYRQALAIRKDVLGEEHPDTETSLNNLGFLLHAMGDHAAARPYYEQVLAIRRKVLGEEHPDTAQSLNNLGVLLQATGDYAAARPYLEQALAITRKVHGEEHPDTAQSLNNLGALLQMLGDYAAARSYLEQALAITRKVHGEEHPDTAQSLNNLGALLQMLGDYAAARSCYEQALAIARKVLGEEHPNTAMLLNNLGSLLQDTGDYAAARPYVEQALAIRRQVLGEEHPDTAAALSRLGSLLQATGDYAAARPHVEQALAIRRQVLGEEHPDTAASLNQLGGLLQATGDYTAARSYLEQALAITRKVHGEEHPDTGRSLNNLGSLLWTTGDYGAARPYYEQALAITRKVRGERHPNTATALNNLGLLIQDTGDYAAARPYYEQALAIRRQVLGEEHPSTAASLSTLGSLLQDTGDYAAARPYLEQALAITRKVLGEDHPETATSLNNLGLLLRETGDSSAARPYYEQALAIRRKVLGEEHPDTAQSLHNLAFLLQATGDYAAAGPYYEQALAIVTKLLDESAVGQSETGQLRMSQSVQYHLDNYVCFLMERRGGDAEAYRAVLNWKGATLVRQRAARLVADNEELAPLLAELQAVVRQWSALVTAPPQADMRWQERLAGLARDKERLELELSGRSAAFRVATVEVPITELQRALPEGASLVDYFEFWSNDMALATPWKRVWKRSLAAFVVRPDGGVQMFNLGRVEPIHAAIDQWRLGYGATAEAKQAAALLREKLWAPLEGAIGDAELVLVSPDGALGKLPFAALPGAKPDSYLIEDVALTLAPVPQLIPALASDAARRDLPRELLVLGGVDYDRRAAAEVTALAAAGTPRRPWDRGTRAAADQQAIVDGVSWPFLSGTESEAAYIAGLYQRLMGLPVGSHRVVSLRGAEATEEAFRSVAPECYLLHLATHGFFAAEDKESALAAAEPEEGRGGGLYGDRISTVRGYSPGLLSGLVLAGANDPPPIPDDPEQLAAMPDDGILTAEEISFLPLSGAHLVVLSACESGLGESAGGEGLLGIQRAFQVAGARTTIATLWKVNDEATRRIMEEFYRNYLEREMSPLEALRAAQLWALNNPQLVPRGADAPADAATTGRLPPQFWAAFTLSGDWR